MTAAGTELGQALSQELEAAGLEPVRLGRDGDLNAALAPGADVLVETRPAHANTLLHDGHAWRGRRRRALEDAAELVAAVRAHPPGRVIYVAPGFMRSPGAGTLVTRDGDLAAELRAQDSLAGLPAPLTVLHLGWLYGPRSRDLWRYETSFRLFRPYYAGPGRLASFLHHADAVAAVLAAAQAPPDVHVVADERPASFQQFMDRWYRLLRRPLAPTHLPRWSLPFLFGQITQTQQEVLDVETSLDASAFRRATAWRPRFPDFEAGLRDALEGRAGSGTLNRPA